MSETTPTPRRGRPRNPPAGAEQESTHVPEQWNAEPGGQLMRVNPFGENPAVTTLGAFANAEQQRGIAEVQARMIIARANPRDQRACMDAILRDCTRPTLAQQALYQYARGGSSISGPSIRLAETLARRWGNIASGIKEISRANGYSECVAYAWDLESGYYDERQFQVRHWRDTRQGGHVLTDERDIYELIANMGQRRKRAVLLTVIPGDVTESAVDQCEETLKANVDISPEALQRLAATFNAFGVSRAQIEKRCQCRLEAIRPAQVVQLRKIYQSLRDDMSAAEDWFPPADGPWGEVQRRQRANTAVPKEQPTREGVARQMEEERNGEPAAGQPPPADSAPLPTEPPPAATSDFPGDAILAEQRAAAAEHDKLTAADLGQTIDEAFPAFEYFLMNDQGEPLGDEPYDSAALWAVSFIARWEHSTNREGLEAHNADAIADAIAISEAAAATLAPLQQPAEPERAPPPIEEIKLPVTRGKPDWEAYIGLVRAALPTLTPGNFLDWCAVQTPRLTAAPASARLVTVKLIAQRAGEIGMQAPTFAPATAASTQPSAGNGADRDGERCQAFVDEIRGMNDLNMLNRYTQAGHVVTLKRRWDRERPELSQRLTDAFSDKQAELRAGA